MGRKKDLAGQKFGKLTVIEETTNPKNRKRSSTFWKCKCDCGNESIVVTSSLTSGKTKQCWECAHYETNKHRRKDYTGQRFGKLVVQSIIYPDRNNKGVATKAVCICDCGNIVTRSTENLVQNLRNGYISSCGCRRKELAEEQTIDVLGKQYGRLLPIEYISLEKPVKVKCLCKCGKETIVAKSDLMAGHTQSCGCLQKERAREANEADYTDVVTETAIKFIKRVRQTKTGQWIWQGRCLICDDVLEGVPSILIHKKRIGCGRHKISSGEMLIENILKETKVKYKPEYTFENCRDKYVLPFDFVVFNDDGSIKLLIEYDGRQHYDSIPFFGGDEAFKVRQCHDKIKSQYCIDHNIPLLRLPYYLSNDEIKEKILNII